MKVVFSEEAERQLSTLPKNHEEAVLEEINSVSDQGFARKSNLKIIRDEAVGEVWSLKVKQGRRGGLDYRVFLDFSQDRLKILSVLYRDNAYKS